MLHKLTCGNSYYIIYKIVQTLQLNAVALTVTIINH